MTEVDFYVLPSEELEPRLTTVCRLAEKAAALGQRVHVYSEDANLLAQLDDSLWSFRAVSFVPHVILRAGDDPQDFIDDPVHLSAHEPALDRRVLINLAATVPPFFSRFERTLEVINDEPAVKRAGRERYRFYRERGYPLRHHAL
ncbi:MAG: DNA polymerase III subunit chi [Gammaproteobacteria bacterium]|nr:MAG: DNA polymerase III subunit chi [Gammaproteobacteria bacterium]